MSCKRMLIIGALAAMLILGSLSGRAQNALIFSGGWQGHKPQETAEWIAAELRDLGYTVTRASSLECLDDAQGLKHYDLIIPNWTAGNITETQLENLSAALKAGTGLGGAHGGMGDAFRDTSEYEAMVGGQFLKHPHVGAYTVDICQPDHPVTDGLPRSFEYNSEQYFMRTSPEITVLATTDYSSVEPGLQMPVTWVQTRGKGRVFYSSLGHNVLSEYKQFPEAKRLFINGLRWATRRPKK